jgi:hypothetical protein
MYRDRFSDFSFSENVKVVKVGWDTEKMHFPNSWSGLAERGEDCIPCSEDKPDTVYKNRWK